MAIHGVMLVIFVELYIYIYSLSFFILESRNHRVKRIIVELPREVFMFLVQTLHIPCMLQYWLFGFWYLYCQSLGHHSITFVLIIIYQPFSYDHAVCYSYKLSMHGTHLSILYFFSSVRFPHHVQETYLIGLCFFIPRANSG